MKKFTMFLFMLTLCGVLAGGVFLLTWDIPAPSSEVSKTIPNSQLLD
ncbi:hypothetical protein [Kiloniella sp. b19]